MAYVPSTAGKKKKRTEKKPKRIKKGKKPTKCRI